MATDEVERFERATENYRRFMDLVQKYIDEESERGIREIRKEVGRERIDPSRSVDALRQESHELMLMISSSITTAQRRVQQGK